MFEPIQGSAFGIAGEGTANPLASFWTAAQMLEHLGEPQAADRLLNAMGRVCAAGILTPDFGGLSSTQEVTDAMMHQIRVTNS